MKTSGATQLDRDPTPGTHAEWLVISASADAASAVQQARERGMRVDHLQLAPDADDEAILDAAAHTRHIVVVETAGKLAERVQRLLPHIGVVPVSGDAPTETILHRLLHTPRCC
jgi:hypothetical protein